MKGNPQGAVTIVEFFDARCGYCKQIQPAVDQMLRRQPDVRLVMKDLPILGPNSVLASRALLAAQRQGKYAELHDALMKLREDPAEPVLKREAERLGLDWAKLRRDMDDPAVGPRSRRISGWPGALRIEGTPALIIGDTLVPGAVDLATLEKAGGRGAREARGLTGCRISSARPAASSSPRASSRRRHCPICEDERQYVPARGQHWTTLDRLQGGHSNTWRRWSPTCWRSAASPAVGIDQRALLVQTPAGNFLWDCIALLDAATITLIRALGGLAGVALSHPHYYSTMVEWGREFGCPVWLHAADRQHVTRPDPCLRFWEGDTQPVLPDLTLHRLGGHFAGGAMAHWRRRRRRERRAAVRRHPAGDAGPPASRLHAQLPLPDPAAPGRGAADGGYCAGLEWEAIYGAFHEREIAAGGKAALARAPRATAPGWRGWWSRSRPPGFED